MGSNFSQKFFKFLKDLEKNNNREWFNANKDRYEEDVRDPFLNFIEAAGPYLRKISPHIVADPRPSGGSLYRIHRDVRFSKDKSPYKTNSGAHFRHAAGKDVPAPSFYVHLSPGESFMVGGMYQPDGKSLRKIRDAIVDHPDRWKTIRAKKLDLSSHDNLIRPPQGFDPDHRYIEDLKRKNFMASVQLTDSQVCAGDFMARFAKECRSMNPLMKFLSSAVGVAW